MTLSNQKISGFITQLKTLKDDIPQQASLRRQLSIAVHELSLALESPLDTVRRISFSLTMGKVAVDLKIFECLNKNGSAMSADDLVYATRADKALLIRVLRYLASVGMITECSKSTYTASNITRTLSIPSFQAALEHHFDGQLPAWLALPSFLASTSYADPTDPTHTPFQVAHHTSLPAFQWAATQPQVMRDFALWMSAQRDGKRSWLDAFPLDSFNDHQACPDTPLFVDVGGGIGHQCLALKAKLPHIKRKIILQDLPSVLEHASPAAGIEHMAYDFRTEQPVCGASYYYLRNVLHDHPDTVCMALLLNLKAAMSCRSAILIDEMVMPDVGAHWQASVDIGVMACLAGKERSEAEWRELVEGVDLRIREIVTYDEEAGNGVITVVL